MDDAERLKRVIKQNRRLKRILGQCWDAAGLLCARMTGKPHQAWSDSDDLVDQIEELAELADNAREAEDRADALAARVRELEGVLASFEWLPDGHGFRWCPVCRFNPAGHAPDCRLAAALAPAPPPPDWTATPPTEPGWYKGPLSNFRLWCPVPLAPPPSPGRAGEGGERGDVAGAKAEAVKEWNRVANAKAPCPSLDGQGAAPGGDKV